MDPLVSWFQSQGGLIDAASMGFTEIDGQGRAAVAKQDLPEGHTLFSIPRTLTLSTRTSSLPRLLGDVLWNKHELGKGWVGLILCMMWEEAQGPASKWSGYLATLPTVFNTPMFWCEEDTEELKGTAVIDKIGKEDTEKDYHGRLIPCLHSRPDLFLPEQLSSCYSLERYHIHGSRILSRSFHVEKLEGEGSDESAEVDRDDMMATDEAPQLIDPDDAGNGGDRSAEAEDSDEEDEEDVGDVAMVPMADMLNARYGSENAKLFYETRNLNMITTKPIKAGEQIWNTYGDPPNSDLLRRYGHVDVIPLPDGGEGNPADIVEIRADLIVDCVSTKPEDMSERIDWWLDQGGDDTFVLDTDPEFPQDCISFIRLLQLSPDEWKRAQKKEKLPKGKMDPAIASISFEVLTKRLAQYPTSIEEDEQLLSPERIGTLSLNKKHAVVVRLGEKRILRSTLDDMKILVQANQGSGKRKADNRDGRGSGKKSKR
ncbi:SET domain-containing protein [Neolentinus lepideus HHB14362 ss-1]|uniref:Ribosomal lysine N-methyltransferase 4 n=1 Tax=Neolentinus lepideus HHB14362 ss-1 TaxID=1314782 RepID=A0A165V4U6_9AGAM|nr:SET domain-containing protein [Neolentinus lepideus HHB14362 ss-1]